MTLAVFAAHWVTGRGDWRKIEALGESVMGLDAYIQLKPIRAAQSRGQNSGSFILISALPVIFIFGILVIFLVIQFYLKAAIILVNSKSFFKSTFRIAIVATSNIAISSASGTTT